MLKWLFSRIKKLVYALNFWAFSPQASQLTDYKHYKPKRSKLENFAPKILLCAQLAVLSIRNANIVSLRSCILLFLQHIRNGFSGGLFHFISGYIRELRGKYFLFHRLVHHPHYLADVHVALILRRRLIVI